MKDGTLKPRLILSVCFHLAESELERTSQPEGIYRKVGKLTREMILETDRQGEKYYLCFREKKWDVGNPEE